MYCFIIFTVLFLFFLVDRQIPTTYTMGLDDVELEIDPHYISVASLFTYPYNQ